MAEVTAELLAFVRSSLPAPPARVLEIGAGDGALARALTAAGHDVTAIDPAAAPDSGVAPVALIDVRGRFDAAVAVVSLHHVDPLTESLAHLATLMDAAAPLVIDELDCDAYDTTAAEWWLGQRRALGILDESLTPEGLVAGLRSHVHPAARVLSALSAHFAVAAPVRGPYLHRWQLRPSLHAAEVDLIAAGRLPAVGWRQVAVRR